MGQVSCRIFLRVNVKEKQPIHKVARICNPYLTGSNTVGHSIVFQRVIRIRLVRLASELPVIYQITLAFCAVTERWG